MLVCVRCEPIPRAGRGRARAHERARARALATQPTLLGVNTLLHRRTVLAATMGRGAQVAAAALCAAAVVAPATVGAVDESVTVLNGSGTTNPSKYLWRVFDTLTTRASRPLRMSYRGVGSSTGQFEFLNADEGYAGNTHFGSGDIPLKQDDYDAVNAAGRTVLHFPFMIGAVTFFHSVPGLPAESTLGLNMTACLLARVFSRDITTWDHPDLLAVNPGLAEFVPAGKNIQVGHRTKGSSSTFAVTSFMHAGCPASWPAEQVGSTVTWEDDTTAVEGSGGMTSMLVDNEWAIGYIDSGHGQGAGLSEIELENADGNFVNSFDADNIRAAATAAVYSANKFPSNPSSSFADADMFNMPGPDTWPIVATSYIYVDKDISALGSSAPVLKAVLEYIISEEGQALVADYGFVGVPPALFNIAKQAINELVLPDAAAHPEWYYEASTDKVNGSGDYVFSVKRNAALEYEVSQLEKAADAMAAQIAALQLQLDAVSGSGRNAELTVVDSDSDGGDSDIAGIVVGAIGCAVGLVALVVAFMAKSAVAKGVPAGARAPEIINNDGKYTTNAAANL